eukprot:CAMPEP_0185694444 /NCGR_PEP_ID=MMETSP1164-20130828/3911_1 /TAXON_ID=1104430 /ORGANISM="Chrysoreinhardia sp, Strain CCMP2950" /LENGTH=123 /DNA_ID=CAMNT_0028361279 /DNA_START=261 /DNA_END=630 /DNA_ORIENTATION=+
MAENARAISACAKVCCLIMSRFAFNIPAAQPGAALQGRHETSDIEVVFTPRRMHAVTTRAPLFLCSFVVVFFCDVGVAICDVGVPIATVAAILSGTVAAVLSVRAWDLAHGVRDLPPRKPAPC